MPVYAAISPKYNYALSMESLSNSGLLAESTMKMVTQPAVIRVNRFENVFVFFTNPDSTKYSQIFHSCMAISALISVAMLFLRTLDGPNLDKYGSGASDYPSMPGESTYETFDAVFTIIFSVDFFLRLMIWPIVWKPSAALRERRLTPFGRDIFNWFDLLALLPWYTDLIFGNGTSFVVMRLARLLRIFRLAKVRAKPFTDIYIYMEIRASIRLIVYNMLYHQDFILSKIFLRSIYNTIVYEIRLPYE
jgi:hypothetical protein